MIGQLRRVGTRMLATGALALTLGVAPAVTLEATAALQLVGHDRVVELPAYGAKGTTAVGYSDDDYARVALPLRNTGWLPVTVHAVDPFPELLGMVETLSSRDLPVTIPAGGDVVVTARVRFTNCEYYTERAVNRFVGAALEVERLGTARTVEVAYPREVVLRSPTILGCPERSTDRSLRQRMLARDD